MFKNKLLLLKRYTIHMFKKNDRKGRAFVDVGLVLGLFFILICSSSPPVFYGLFYGSSSSSSSIFLPHGFTSYASPDPGIPATGGETQTGNTGTDTGTTGTEDTGTDTGTPTTPPPTQDAATEENQPPVANAGPDQTAVQPGQTVRLDGRQSSDPDPGGRIDSYSWSLVSSPPGGPAEINVRPNDNRGASQARFTAPQIPGDYTFQLVVTDNEDATSAPDTVLIRIVGGVETTPTPAPTPAPTTPSDQLPDQPDTTTNETTTTPSTAPTNETTTTTPSTTAGTAKATLTVITRVTGPVFATLAQPSDFTIRVYASNSNPFESQGSESGTTVSFDAGRYEVEVYQQPAGYLQSFSGDCSGNIINNQTLPGVCTITNHYGTNIELLSTLRVNVNINPTPPEPLDFQIQIIGTPATPAKYGVVISDVRDITVFGGSNYEVVAQNPVNGIGISYNATYSDGCRGSIIFRETKTCTITYNAFEPAQVNQRPIANAGPDQTVQPGSTVTLDGTGSSDPDGTITSYSWFLAGCPDGCVNPIRVQPGPTDPTPTFTAPQIPGDYTFQLAVRDDKGVSSPPDNVVIRVIGLTPPPPGSGEGEGTPPIPPQQQPPIADAGPDQTVQPGASVTLDGTGSRDPDGTIVSYHWFLVSSPGGFGGITLQPNNNNQASRTTFTAPQTPGGDFTFQLVVTDDEGVFSAPDTVVIRVERGLLF
jgi:PKD domain